jgi:hypothetical protein
VIRDRSADGELVQYGYDAAAVQVSITPVGQPSIVSAVRRNARGQTVEVEYGNGVVSRHVYRDATDQRLESLETAGPAGIIQRYRYVFDAVGNLVGIEDDCDEADTSQSCSSSGPYSATYRYDSLGQLVGMATSTGQYPFGYDAIGNLTYHEDGGHAPLVQSYGPRTPAGRTLPHAPAASANDAFSYDENGNLFGSSTGLALTWNAENMATDVRTPTSQARKSFVGEHVWKKVEDGLLTYYLPGLLVLPFALPAKGMDVAVLENGIATWLRENPGAMSPDKLKRLSTFIGKEYGPSIGNAIENFADPVADRPYVALSAGKDGPTIYVLGWRAGDATVIHGHGASAVGVYVYQGAVGETAFGASGGAARTLQAGQSLCLPCSWVHEFHNVGGDLAVTVHSYFPQLSEMELFEMSGDKLLRVGKWADTSP